MSSKKGHYILKLNNKCNMNCLFCADSVKTRNLSNPLFKEIIANLKKNRLKYNSLIITGGEPTIYDKLYNIIKYSKKVLKFEPISLVTNGVAISNIKFLETLIKLGVGSFQISYFAINKKQHDALSRSKNTFKLVNKGIINAVQRKKNVRINIVINKINYKDLPKITEHLVKLKVNSINLAFMNPVGTSIVNNISILAIEYKNTMPFIKECFRVSKKLKFNNLYIENFPICMSREYIDMISDLNNPIENKDYYNISKIKPKKCNSCSYYDICKGTWKAYINQFGDKEISPIILKDKKKDNRAKIKFISSYIDFNKEKPLFNKYLFEIAGIELGLKKASILYLNKKKIPYYIKELKKKGLFSTISDFSYITNNEITKKVEKGSIGEHSLYISKNKKYTERLKYLDYYHQFKKKEPKGMNSNEIFFEIAKIFGYPRCCSEFLLSVHNNLEYEKLFKKSNKQYQDETIYKLLALKNNHKIKYQLNNFSISYPKLFNFFVCKYDCKKSLKIANKLLNYIKKFYPEKYKAFIKDLRTSILFFSSYRVIYLMNTKKIGNRIKYSDCFYIEEQIKSIDKNKRIRFNKIFMMLKEGNSFKINTNKILIYKDDAPIHIIIKENSYDGIFIEFK